MERNNNSYHTLLEEFLHFNILVKCPNCNNKATVYTGSFFTNREISNEIKVACTQCGYSKIGNSSSSSVAFEFKNKTINGVYYIIGAPVDPFFQIPVWLQINVGSNLLWAYNIEHLFFLKLFVSAKIRERHQEHEFSNKSLGSRLPKWLTSAKNREKVLKKITALEYLSK